MNHSGSWNVDVDVATVDVVVDTVPADFDSIVGPGFPGDFLDGFTFDFIVDVVIVVLVVDVDVVGIDVNVEVSVLSSGMDVKNRIAELIFRYSNIELSASPGRKVNDLANSLLMLVT